MHAHRLGAVVAAMGFVAIAALTLVPVHGNDPIFLPFWCIACGDTGLVDALLNVALFVPFGAGLVLVGTRRHVAMLAVIVTTAAVELLQYTLIAGRDSSGSDIVANALGGALGIVLASTWREWLAPSPRAAAGATLLACAGWLAIVAVSAMGFQLAPPYPTVIAQHAPQLGRFPPFDGDVLGAALGDARVADGAELDGRTVHTRLLQGATFTASFAPASDSPGPVAIVRLVDADGHERASFAQDGDDLIFRLRTRSADWRLRTPNLRVGGGLQLAGAGVIDTMSAIGSIEGRELHLQFHRVGKSARRRLTPTPGRAWYFLFEPHGEAVAQEIATLAWSLVLVIPLGYFAARAGFARSAPTGGGGWRSRIVLFLPLITIAIGFGVLAPALGLPAAPWPEWAAAFGGLVTGAAAGRSSMAAPPGIVSRLPRAAAILMTAWISATCDARSSSSTSRSDGASPADSASAAATAGVVLPIIPDSILPESRFRIDTIARGLEVPWSLDIAPDGRIFLAERVGRIRVIEGGRLLESPWLEMDVYARDDDYRPESGLMGLSISPDFSSTGHVYVVGTFWRDGAREPPGMLERIRRRLGAGDRATPWEGRVYRISDRERRGSDPRVIVGDLPGNHYHVGGALEFGPDGMLYVSTGEALDDAAARNPRSRAGKILRLHPDGTIPADNPLPGSPVFATGFRNPQGLAWLSTGELLAIDHGPSGGTADGGRLGQDRLHLVVSGGHYGWPPSDADTARTRAPIAEWTPAIAPAGLTVWRDSTFGWSDDVFIAELQGRRVRRLAVERDAHAPSGWRIASQSALPLAQMGRLRLVEASGGCLYIGTSNHDGRGMPGSGDDLLLRVCPATRD